MLDTWIALARSRGASDLHLEPGMPPAIRVGGRLSVVGEPVDAQRLLAEARALVGPELWSEFVARRSYDGSRVLGGVRCRVNVLQSSRGVGLAIRLLNAEIPTLARLNLHPDLAELARLRHGLVLICGPTGAGKSSTLAALVEEINRAQPCHIVTLEQPIEYHFRPRRAFIRQREVGRDTPSFEQGLLDAMREDPDVLMVGEMRRRQTMQLTLDAAETGHVVLATLHASTPAEAVSRLVAAFPPESQQSVRAQLANCLAAVLCQTLRYLPEQRIRVPECEILRSNSGVKANIRDGAFFKLTSAMETGAVDGMWTAERYRRWLDGQRDFYTPPRQAAAESVGPAPAPIVRPSAPSVAAAVARPAAPTARWSLDDDDEPGLGDVDDLIAELKGRR